MGKYLGEFELVVLLASLRAGGRATGAEVYREIVQVARRKTSIPSMYVTLQRLEQKGLVQSHVNSGGQRDVKLFTVTSAGSAAVKRSREQLERLWSPIEPAWSRT